jgi:hypothetical protein
MKISQVLLCGTISLATLPSAKAYYFSNFQSPTYVTTGYATLPGVDLTGKDGWVIDAANAPGVGSQTTPSQLSTFVQLVSGSGDTWGSLGGQWAAPNTTSVELSHSATQPLYNTFFSVDLDIVPGAIGTRDKFGWSFKNSSSSDLMRVAFEPGNASHMQVFWYDGAGAPHILGPVGQDIAYNGIYNLSVNFNGLSGSDLTFTATIAGSTSYTWGGTLTGAAGANLASINADFDATGTAANAGTNYMAFDNLLLVPEPSSMLTAGLALLGLTTRRRRK